MNKYYFLLLIAFFHLESGWSQCDYSTAKYQVGSDKNLFYGVLPDYRNIQDSLFLDVYYPIGSTEKLKPMVLWAFGGGFFQGKRQDLAAVCNELAARGFVSVTIDYRLGFDGPSAGFNPPFSYDKAEILRAGYRGVTDMKGAIRFMKAKHQDYGIDLERVWIGGESAGSIVALNAAFLDKESEKPKETYSIGPIGSKQRLDLGPIEGTLNINGYDAKVQGVFNFFGALLDTNEIDATNNIAVFSYHQADDPIVPCKINTPYYQIPLIDANYPIVFGTCAMTDRLQNLGIDPIYWESWIYPGNQHGVHDETAVINFMMANAKPLLCKNISAVSEKTSALESVFLQPNPAYQFLQIQNIEGNFSYTFYTLSGKTIKTEQSNSNSKIDVSALQTGMYLIKIIRHGESRTFKWLKS